MKPRYLLAFCLSSAAFAGSNPQLIVDWGHDWGTGWYRQSPGQQVNGTWKPLDTRDLNGNGITEDDWIGGWGYDWDVPLSPSNLVYDDSYPSATFYGAAVVRVTDLPRKEDGDGYDRKGAPSEGHINQNHELRDDWNLMAMPPRKRHPELAQFAGAMLVFWKKEDFLNGGDAYPVSLPEGSAIGIFISRYWGGIDWGRWVVRDSGQFYISEDTFAGQTEPFKIDLSVDITEAERLPNGAKNPVVRTTHTIDPTQTRWARYDPRAPDDLFFDPSQADFASQSFNDVEAVGFLAQRDFAVGYPTAAGLWKEPYGLGEPIALKFNAAQVRGVVDAPEGFTAIVPMEPIEVDGQPALYVAKTETTYRQWAEVWKWAVTNQRAAHFTEGFEQFRIPGYVFFRDGVPGSAETGLSESHTVNEPVTTVSWHDAVVWCNALSELEGLRPTYYADADFSQPLRTVMERRYREKADARPAVYFDATAPGYRLPTGAEFAYLYTQGGTLQGWDADTANQRTHPVATSPADANGLYDLYGNVAEYIWPGGSVFDPAKANTYWAVGGSAFGDEAESAMPFGGVPAQGSHAVGFRVVRNGFVPLPSASADGIPRQQIQAGQTLPSHRSIDPQTVANLARERLGTHVFSGAGSLPSNDNPNKNYPAQESYDLGVSEVEVPYWLWNIVRQWATFQAGYRFNHGGDMGSLLYLTDDAEPATHSRDEPVTNITWYDAVVWCNALSELTGRQPVYIDQQSGEPLRDASIARLPMYPEYHYMNTGRDQHRPIDDAAVIELQVDTQANGYRLPSMAELEAVAVASKNLDEAWLRPNSGLRTHPVATREPNASGLYDIEGNVHEMTYGGDKLFGQARFGTHFADEPGVPPHPMNRKENPFVGRPYLGFRPVWRVD